MKTLNEENSLEIINILKAHDAFRDDYEIKDQKLVNEFGLMCGLRKPNKVRFVLVTNEDKLLSIGEDGTMKLWLANQTTGPELKEIRMYKFDNEPIIWAALSPDGTQILCATSGKKGTSSTIKLLDFSSSEALSAHKVNSTINIINWHGKDVLAVSCKGFEKFCIQNNKIFSQVDGKLESNIKSELFLGDNVRSERISELQQETTIENENFSRSNDNSNKRRGTKNRYHNAREQEGIREVNTKRNVPYSSPSVLHSYSSTNQCQTSIQRIDDRSAVVIQSGLEEEKKFSNK